MLVISVVMIDIVVMRVQGSLGMGSMGMGSLGLGMGSMGMGSMGMGSMGLGMRPMGMMGMGLDMMPGKRSSNLHSRFVTRAHLVASKRPVPSAGLSHLLICMQHAIVRFMLIIRGRWSTATERKLSEQA